MTNRLNLEKELKNILTGYSTGKVGSFGEFIFQKVYQNYHRLSVIKPLHKHQTDFIVDKRRVDVKTKCIPSINKEFKSIYIFSGLKVPRVNYSTVAFYKDCFVVSYKGWSKKINNNSLLSYHKNWKKEREVRTAKNTKTSQTKNKHLKKYHLLIDNIRMHFKGVELHFLYRSHTWGGKSNPGNLLPQCIRDKIVYFNPKKQFRIYLEFKSPKFSTDNINRIIAYYEPKYKNLFKIIPASKAHLSNNLWSKVDMDKMPKNVIFKSIGELKRNLLK
jgi:hypothetical protein